MVVAPLRVPPHQVSFLLAQRPSLAQNFRWDVHLSDVVQQRTDTQLPQLAHGKSEGDAEQQRDDAHVDRVPVRVRILSANFLQSEDRRTCCQDLVEKAVDRLLDRVHTEGPSDSNRFECFFDLLHCVRAHALGNDLGRDVLLPGIQDIDGRDIEPAQPLNVRTSETYSALEKDASVLSDDGSG